MKVISFLSDFFKPSLMPEEKVRVISGSLGTADGCRAALAHSLAALDMF